jgi:hypothetical protein
MGRSLRQAIKLMWRLQKLAVKPKNRIPLDFPDTASISMPPRADEPIAALFDLSIDNIDDLGGAREAADQIGEHSADGDCGYWQSVGAHGRVLLDRPRQSVARNLNDHLLLAGKRVFRHPIPSRSVCVNAIKCFPF